MVSAAQFLLHAPLTGLVRITFQVSTASNESINTAALTHDPFQFPSSVIRLNAAFKRLLALKSNPALKETPFVVLPLPPDTLQIVCFKPAVAKLFKHLLSNQTPLGVTIKDLKTHVTLTAMQPDELERVISAAVVQGLTGQGDWWQLDGNTVMGCNVLQAPPGQMHTCPSLTLSVQVQQPGTIVVCMKPEMVGFRYQLALSGGGGQEGAVDLKAINQRAVGGICTVLPDLRKGIVDKVRVAGPSELTALHTVWSGLGPQYTLSTSPPSSPATCPPTSSIKQTSTGVVWESLVVDVRFDADEDSEAFTFPACSLLTTMGIDSFEEGLHSPQVLAILQRIQSDLTRKPFSLWTSGINLVSIHEWDPYTTSIDPPNNTRSHQHHNQKQPCLQLQSAAEVLAGQAAAATAAALHPALGKTIDLTHCHAALFESTPGKPDEPGELGSITMRTSIRKKPHARAGPLLAALLKNIQAMEDGENVHPPRPGSGKAVQTPGVEQSNGGISMATPAVYKLTPLLPRSTLGKTTAPKPGVKLGGPSTVKKAAAAAAVAAGPPGIKKKVLKTQIVASGASNVASIGGDAAGAKPAAKPRAKPTDIDVASLDIPVLAANGKLSSLAIPQMKAYLKSVKLAVGGKKADLEARIKMHLGIA